MPTPSTPFPMGLSSRRGALAVDLLRAGTSVRLTATGSSMAPAIRSGDVVVVEPLVGALWVGELVFVRCASTLRIHRVVALAPLRTAGDNLDASDPAVDEVLGRVRAIEKTRWSLLASSARRLERHVRTILFG